MNIPKGTSVDPASISLNLNNKGDLKDYVKYIVTIRSSDGATLSKTIPPPILATTEEPLLSSVEFYIVLKAEAGEVNSTSMTYEESPVLES